MRLQNLLIYTNKRSLNFPIVSLIQKCFFLNITGERYQNIEKKLKHREEVFFVVLVF